MNNIHWLADDEAYPQAIPHIRGRRLLMGWRRTRQWRLPNLFLKRSGSRKRLSTSPSATSPPLAGRCRTGSGIKATRSCYFKKHIFKSQLYTLQYLTVRGWKCHGVEAEPTGNGGSTGGFLTIHSSRHLIRLHLHQAGQWVDSFACKGKEETSSSSRFACERVRAFNEILNFSKFWITFNLLSSLGGIGNRSS